MKRRGDLGVKRKGGGGVDVLWNEGALYDGCMCSSVEMVHSVEQKGTRSNNLSMYPFVMAGSTGRELDVSMKSLLEMGSLMAEDAIMRFTLVRLLNIISTSYPMVNHPVMLVYELPGMSAKSWATEF